MDTDLQQTEHLQISFSPTDQDRRYAGKRLLRYIEPAWRRKYWFGSAAFLLVWGSLFVFACWLLNDINNTYIQNCYLFADSQTDSLEYCLYKAGDDGSSLWIMAGLIYATTMVTYFEQRWTYRSFTRIVGHPLDGRRFSVILSAEGLLRRRQGAAGISIIGQAWNVSSKTKHSCCFISTVTSSILFRLPLLQRREWMPTRFIPVLWS